LDAVQQRPDLVIGRKGPDRTDRQAGAAPLAALTGKNRRFPRLDGLSRAEIVTGGTRGKFINRVQTAIRRQTKRLTGQGFAPVLGER
jgi:hypothetical protein